MDPTPSRRPGSALLRSAPLWITSIVTIGFFATGNEPLTARALPSLALSVFLSLGFWTLFLGSVRALQRLSRWTLVVTLPLFLILLALGAIQAGHSYVYGAFVDKARLGAAITNWEVVSSELANFARSLGWALPATAAILSVSVVVGVGFTRASWLRPLRGSGGVHTAAALAFGVWLLWTPFQALAPPRLPDIAGVQLADEVSQKGHWKVLRENGPRRLPRPSGWLLQRKGVRPPPPPPPGDAPRPNVLFILLESVRADHLTPYGYPRATTPHLEEWAQRPDVTRFRWAFSNATFSYFSMLSLTSGLDLRRDAAQFSTAPLIWDYLKPRGYQTLMVTFSLSYPAYGLDRFFQTPGLDLYRDVGREHIDAALRKRPQDTLLGRLQRALLGEGGFEESLVQRNDQLTLDVLRKAIHARRRDAPFFALWELECTHFRYCYYGDKYHRFEPSSPYHFSRANPTQLINDYDNALIYEDDEVQGALSLLEQEGIADDTVVVIASDHGEAFYEHGTVFHGFGYHPEQTHVPLFIRIPEPLRERYPAAALAALEQNQSEPVELADLLPTIVALADGDPTPSDPAWVDGANLLAAHPAREIYTTNYPTWRRKAYRWRPHALVNGDHTLVVAEHKGEAEDRIPLAVSTARAR